MTLDDGRTVAAVAAVIELAGHDVTTELCLPDAPWDLGTDRSVRLVRLGGADQRTREDAVQLALRGGGLVLALPEQLTGRDRFLEAVRRVAPVLDWRSETVLRLDPSQIELLYQVAQGASVEVAAARVHVSARTAHRRLASAKAAVGVTSTIRAAETVVDAVRVWSGS